MSSYSPTSINVSHSPHSMTDGDSAIGGDTTPEQERETHFIGDQNNENFECFGEKKDDDTEFQSVMTPALEKGLIRRNSWARSSLRVTSPTLDKVVVPPKRWGSFQPGRHSSSSTAAALYTSGTVISSSLHSSNGDDGDMLDIQSVSSIEEDVVDLDNKVHQLQEQLGILVDKQAATDERYSKVKQDNTNLTARIHILEEQISEIRTRGEERLEEEKKRNKDLSQRLEREKQLEIENYSIRLQGMENNQIILSNEVVELKAQLEHARENKNRMEKNLSETQIILIKEQEDNKLLKEERAKAMQLQTEGASSSHRVQEMSIKVEQLRNQKADLSQNDSGMQLQECDEVFEDHPARIVELQMENRVLRNQNKSVNESYEELQAQMLNKDLAEGRSLLICNQSQKNSLASEFEAMSELELRKALQEQTNLNMQLQNYVDSVLLNIMEKDPGLLEVRNK